MSFVALSVVMATLAAITGVLAIGSGKHWDFEIKDYFRGKRNAILYVWVITSTIFSICHAGVLAEYGFKYNWGYRHPDQSTWFYLHSFMGILLTTAHLYVANTLAKEVGPVDKYLWGRRHRAIV